LPLFALTNSVNGLVGSSFLAFFRIFFAMFLVPPFFFGRPPVLGRRRTLCTLIAKNCRGIEDFVCPCNSDTCAAAALRVGNGTGVLGVELINAEVNRSTGEQAKPAGLKACFVPQAKPAPHFSPELWNGEKTGDTGVEVPS
jgi:hypothetical protein